MAEIFTRFNPEQDVVSNLRQTVSSGMWSGGTGTLTTFFTSSTQSSSNGQYYYDMYKTDPASDSTAEIQFSVAFGDRNGSGSLGQTGNYPSKAIYAQYRNLLLTPGDSKFTFGGSVDSDRIYVLTMGRARLREKMDPGNWELHISGSGNKKYKFIDDSGATTNPTVNQGGRVFNIVSGSISGGVTSTHTEAALQGDGAYGLFYPDLGILVFNGPALNASASLSTASGSNVAGGNVVEFYEDIRVASYFQARREEVITSQHYFCRVPNKALNFSSNPTFTTGSNGAFTVPTFEKNPKSFITQVGLYNDNNELLAVANLSKPLQKSYSKEAIIKVKLDF